MNFAASLDQPAAQVAFIFAQPWSRPPQVLWASKPILVAASPYFAAMLDSGMSEAALVPANEPLDDGLARDPSPVLAPDDPRVVGLGAAAHRVVVKDTSAPVYRAVLLWIMTGVVDFDSTGAADDQLPPARAEDVYILADKLELPPLKVRWGLEAALTRAGLGAAGVSGRASRRQPHRSGFRAHGRLPGR